MKKWIWYGLSGIALVFLVILLVVYSNKADFNSCIKDGGESIIDGQCILDSNVFLKEGSAIDLTNCVSYFDGCNNCMVLDGKLVGCTLIACENYEAPECLYKIDDGGLVGGDVDSHGCIGSAGYIWDAEENVCLRPWMKKEHIAKLVLSEDDCLKNNGEVSGDLICDLVKPKVYTEGEVVPQDYSNGDLLLSGISDSDCEGNNGKNMLDGNGIKFCFVPLNNLPQIIDDGGLTDPMFEGAMCGGIAGLQCEAGYSCRMDGDYPDASGICVKKTL